MYISDFFFLFKNSKIQNKLFEIPNIYFKSIKNILCGSKEDFIQ